MKTLVGVIIGIAVGLYVGTQTERVTQAQRIADVTHVSYWQVISPCSRPWIKILSQKGN